mmetsp:Transcript_14897/g.28008  ORF Transcript_14897/g.28008 Transcript_14897/m.28008 type:complete len:123 (-) Transcript_14897:2144-2512(-)
MSNPIKNVDDKDDDSSVHQSIPTLGEERISLEIPDFEEKFMELPTLEELEEETKKYMEKLPQTDFKDNWTEETASTEQPLRTNQNNTKSIPACFDMEEDDEDIEKIVYSISGMLSKYKDYWK